MPCRSNGRTKAERPAGSPWRTTVAAVALMAFGLSACGGDVVTRGNMPDPDLIADIQPGADNREDVADMLGSPSAVSTFMDDKWYYIGHKVEYFAFFEPAVLERSVLVVSFDGVGTVDDTILYTLEDGQIIDPIGRKTPTEGRELTLLQQFFGNLGRFPVGTEQQ